MVRINKEDILDYKRSIINNSFDKNKFFDKVIKFNKDENNIYGNDDGVEEST